MCGILYIKRENGVNASKTAFKRYKKQSLRGKDGFGYIALKGNKIGKVKRFQTEAEMEKELKTEESDEILLHHRYPTSTPNLAPVNHPIEVKSRLLKKNYYVIHNGVIDNDLLLKKEHEEFGFKYTTDMTKSTVYDFQSGESIVEVKEECFNDSEVFAIDLALYLEGKQDTIKSAGSISFICYQTNKSGTIEKMHYGHNCGNPLVLEDSKDMFILKSTGHGKKLDTDVLFTKDYSSGEITQKKVEIGFEYGTYVHKGEYKSERGGKMGFRTDFEDDYCDNTYSLNSLENDLNDLKEKRIDKSMELSELNISIANGSVDEIDVYEQVEQLQRDLEDIADSILDVELELQAFLM